LADVLAHACLCVSARRQAASEIASGSKLGIDATRKLPGEGFKSRPVGTAHQDGCGGESEGGKTVCPTSRAMIDQSKGVLHHLHEPDETHYDQSSG